jgi:hypothetical protein
MGGSTSSRFVEQFDPAIKLPQDAANQPGGSKPVVASDDRIVASIALPRTLQRPWLVRHTAVHGSAPLFTWHAAMQSGGKGAVPVTLLQLQPCNHYADGSSGSRAQPPQLARAALYRCAASALRMVAASRADTTPERAFVPVMCHVEAPDAAINGPLQASLADSGYAFAVVTGLYVPALTPYLPIPAAALDASGQPRSPDLLDVTTAIPQAPHAVVARYRSLRKRCVLPVVAAMPTGEVLLLLNDVVTSLLALHNAGVQLRNLHWATIYCDVDAPAARMPFTAAVEYQYAATAETMAAAGFQKLVADTVSGRGPMELPFVAPEDRDPSLSDEGRAKMPFGASDAFAFGQLLEQLLPPSAVESATQDGSAAVAGLSARAAADALVRFAKSCQVQDPAQRPSLRSFFTLVPVLRCSFVNVMRQLDEFYGGPTVTSCDASPAYAASRIPTAKLLTGDARQMVHLRRCQFLSALHIELYKMPYDLMARRVIPRLFLPYVFNDPCAGPLLAQLLTAAPSGTPSASTPPLTIAAAEPHRQPPSANGRAGLARGGAVHPVSGASIPGFVVHGVLMEKEHLAWCTALIEAPWAFGSPATVAQSPRTYTLMALLRNLEGYVFSVDIGLINDKIIPSVVQLLLHPAPDVAAEAVRCFGALCRFVFAAVEEKRDVGTAKGQLVAAFDAQVYELAVSAASSPDLRLAALRITARSLAKHHLMTRSKAVEALYRGLEPVAPPSPSTSQKADDVAAMFMGGGADGVKVTPSVLDESIDLVETLAFISEAGGRTTGGSFVTPKARRSSRSFAQGPPDTNDNGSATGSRSPGTPGTPATPGLNGVREGFLGHLMAVEVAETFIPALLRLAMAQQLPPGTSTRCMALMQRMLAALGSLPGPGPEGASTTSSSSKPPGWCLAPATSAASRAWQAALANPAGNSNSSNNEQQGAQGAKTQRPFGGPAELLERDAHLPLYAAPIMGVNPADGLGTAVPPLSAGQQVAAAADAVPLVCRGRGGSDEGRAIIVVPTPLNPIDVDTEWNSSGFLAFTGVIGKLNSNAPNTIAGSNTRPHPLGPKLSTRPDGGSTNANSAQASAAAGGEFAAGEGAATVRTGRRGLAGGRNPAAKRKEEAAAAAARAVALAAALEGGSGAAAATAATTAQAGSTDGFPVATADAGSTTHAAAVAVEPVVESQQELHTEDPAPVQTKVAVPRKRRPVADAMSPTIDASPSAFPFTSPPPQPAATRQSAAPAPAPPQQRQVQPGQFQQPARVTDAGPKMTARQPNSSVQIKPLNDDEAADL